MSGRPVAKVTREPFHHAADLVDLEPRVRLELEEPDYEHTFHLTTPLQDRLLPVPEARSDRYAGLLSSRIPNQALIALPDGAYIVPDGLLQRGARNDMKAHIERTIRHNYRLVRDIADDRRRVTPDYDSGRYLVGQKMSARLAAMVLALKRIEAHYQIVGFSR